MECFDASRPHTPGTPVAGMGMSVGLGVMGPGVSYVQAPHPPPPHHMVSFTLIYLLHLNLIFFSIGLVYSQITRLIDFKRDYSADFNLLKNPQIVKQNQ